MSRHRMLWFAIGMLILSSLACNAFAGDAPEPALTLPPPPISVTETAQGGEEIGLAPTATLPGGSTPAPLVDPAGNPLLEALVDVNVRTGPGVQYQRDGFLFSGESARVLGRDPNTGWWKIECPGRADGQECWVSGGSQYTNVTNGEGVPVAVAPPTPTPQPSPTPADLPDAGTSLAQNGRLAYTDNAGLWLVTLDLSQDVPTGSDPVQIVDDPSAQRPFFSPDGRQLAYITETDEANALHVFNLDSGEDQILVNSADLSVTAENFAPDSPVLILQAAWLADSQSIVFNSGVLNQGIGLQNDLWSVDLGGAAMNLFLGGEGGGAFAISADDQVIFGQREALVRANLDGTGSETIIPFDPINTASEYIFYPQAQVANDGSAYVAIPNAEPWGEEARAALWRIPASGPAEKLETLTGNILFNPVYWSPDGGRLAYVQQEIDPSNPPPVLVLAEGDGRNPAPYTSDQQLTLYGWSSDGGRFLYAGNGEYAVGQVGVPPTQYPMQGATAGMQWLTPSTFITVIGGPGSWNLRSNNVNGDLDLLTISDGDFVFFDVWTP